MTTDEVRLAQKQYAIDYLRDICSPGTTLYLVPRYSSRNALNLAVDALLLEHTDGKLRRTTLTNRIADALGARLNRNGPISITAGTHGATMFVQRLSKLLHGATGKLLLTMEWI